MIASTVASFIGVYICNKWEAKEVFILDLSVYLLSYLEAETITAQKGSLTFTPRLSQRCLWDGLLPRRRAARRHSRGVRPKNVLNVRVNEVVWRQGQHSLVPKLAPNPKAKPSALTLNLKQFIKNRQFAFSSFYFKYFLLITCLVLGNSSCVPQHHDLLLAYPVSGSKLGA